VKVLNINPITRLEGHGKIVIVLDDAGNLLKHTYRYPSLEDSKNSL